VHNRMIMVCLALLSASTAVWAGEGKCTANTQECLDYMATKMKDSGWIGIEMNVEPGGVMEILKVVPGSPAETGGMKPGDFLVAMNGLEFNDANQEALQQMRSESKPGSSVMYTVTRSGEKHDLTLTLAAMPADVLARYIGQHMLEHASTAMPKENAEAQPGS
jgi:C-terminal processing protease CtpA/Prc